MIRQAEILQHYRTLATSQSTALPIQKQAAMHMQALNLPSKKDEAWHYTPVTPLLEHQFSPANDDLIDLSYESIREFLLGDRQDIRFVLVNGRFNSKLSHVPDEINGLYVGSLQAEVKSGTADVINRLGMLSAEGSHLFSALNTAGFNDGAYIKIARDTMIGKPIELLHLSVSSEDALISQPRNLIILEENANATVVESYASSENKPCFNNIISEIYLGENAVLDHPRLQNENRSTRHLSGLYVRQDKGSRYQCTTTELGANWSRTEFNVELVGENAECILNGLYLVGDNQTTGIHLNISHAVPSCTSREYFKGILKGKGRGIFDGNVIVEKDAQKTDAHLKNANLLLSRQAEIDTKPVLQISADDVQCSHGTTVGQIDPELLFYLRTRGIPELQARRLICLGFAKEILQNYNWRTMRKRIEKILETRLTRIFHRNASNLTQAYDSMNESSTISKVQRVP